MMLVCKQNFIQFETTTKRINFTIGNSYKVHEINEFMIKLIDDADNVCRFFSKPGVILYLYNYFHEVEESRDIILKKITK